MRVVLSDILNQTVTVFYKTDAKDRTDGVKTDLWRNKVMPAQFTSKIESSSGNGTLAKTEVYKIHLTATDWHDYRDYLINGGWTVRPGDCIALGSHNTVDVKVIQALPNLCKVSAVNPRNRSGLPTGHGAALWFDSIYCEGF